MAINNQHIGFGMMAAGGAMLLTSFMPSAISPVSGMPPGAMMVGGIGVAAMGTALTIINGKV